MAIVSIEPNRVHIMSPVIFSFVSVFAFCDMYGFMTVFSTISHIIISIGIIRRVGIIELKYRYSVNVIIHPAIRCSVDHLSVRVL